MIQETLDKLQTVRDTLKDANEINEYKEKELNEKVKQVFYSSTNRFPVWLRNRLLSAGLEPVFSHTEKAFFLRATSLRRVFSFHKIDISLLEKLQI